MCGITGIVHLSDTAAGRDLRGSLAAMTRALAHRGPDDEGIFITRDGRVGLGNRRLAIRDLSPAGHMPMGDAAGTLRITYNGEIYNADTLREELERRGQVFSSTSDTEVILHGYAAWGARVVDRLRGMFAFAIWDERRGPGAGRLFLARDRLGIKPLYYARTRDALLFASELRALQASGLVSEELSPAGLVGYLTLGTVPNPLTIYEGIQALEPGSTLSLAPDGAGLEKERYWSLPTETAAPGRYPETVEQIRGLLEEAVRIRLVSDVPLGAFLSGGIDSSAVVALMRKATSGPIRTCSMVFEEAEFSEAPYARAMAEAVGAEHHERVITARDVVCELDRIWWAMDQPSIDGVNTFFVSQTARQAGLTVALSGLGGDELFGGYRNTFQGVPQMLKALARVQSVSGGARLARAATGMLPNPAKWARVRDGLTRPASAASAYLVRRGLFSPSEVRQLVSPEVWRLAAERFDPVGHVDARAGGASGNGNLRAWISRAELAVYTHHQLLRDTDVMSMAHSLEVREPLLDHQLVEAALRLPGGHERNGAGPKPLLMDAIGAELPEIVRAPRAKQGFFFPLDVWMRGPLKGQVQESLLHALPSELLDAEAVRRVWQAYQEGHVHWTRPWSLAALGGWLAAAQHSDGS